MQVKTIKRQISMKMTEWLFSIEDEALRNRVKKSLLVTGGSITSIFLNEDVNDYDVYIGERIEVLNTNGQYDHLINVSDD